MGPDFYIDDILLLNYLFEAVVIGEFQEFCILCSVSLYFWIKS